MKLTDAEWKVMGALWSESPATTSEIMERLPRGNSWAYSTVKTILYRLIDKGIISEYKRSKLSFYKPIVTKKEARKSEFKSLLGKAFGGTIKPLLNFIVEDEISEEDKKELIEMLKTEDSKKEEK